MSKAEQTTWEHASSAIEVDETRLEGSGALFRLIDQLHALQDRMRQIETTFADRLEQISERRVASARNLLHYVSIRQQDLRSLQHELSRRGLSSLGRCESNVEASVSAVIEILYRLSGQDSKRIATPSIDFEQSRRLSDRSTEELFGPKAASGAAHIMVTMPSEAAHDRSVVFDLVAHGMDCMRINCAHDDSVAWQGMIENLRWACSQQRRQCKVVMDLAGPKLRTGPIEVGPAVLKWRPLRDALGRTIAPARIWLHRDGSTGQPPVPADACLPIIANWFGDIQIGDEIHLADTRNRSRCLKITEQGEGGFWAESTRTAYVVPGTEMTLHALGGKKHRQGRVGKLDASDQFIVLRRGSRLMLGDEYMVGAPAKYDEHGRLVRPAMIGCSLPSVFRDLKQGERVLFDDGKIATRVEEIHEHYVLLNVVAAGDQEIKLRADKGVNFPDTNIQLDALTEKDVNDLAFIAEHADIVEYSFIRRPEDVGRLQSELATLGRPDMPIVLKIENRQAFDQLPSLLLTAMRSPIGGVMIARGDLAVELGWQRLAEVQEEILWMCEAAHMPVVWATQVLESLAKTGIPSRAEITDAAMGVRAECVMLNKGPYIVEAVRVLGDILRRMQDHQIKKRPLFRRLRLADDLMVGPGSGQVGA